MAGEACDAATELGIPSPEFRRKAKGPDLDPVTFCCLSEQVEVERTIAILEKRPLAPVAALGHVVGNAGQDHAGDAGHIARLAYRGSYINRMYVTVIPISAQGMALKL